jgi:hypothetical protein
MIGVMASGGIARQALGVRKKWRIHTRLSWALTVAVATHIGTIFASHYHGWTVAYATAIGWGTVARQTAVIATWLLLVVLVTTAAKTTIPTRLWRVIHRTAPAVILVLATIHGLYAGGARHQAYIVLPGLTALTFLASVLIVRGYDEHVRRRKRAAATTNTAHVTVAPLQRH